MARPREAGGHHYKQGDALGLLACMVIGIVVRLDLPPRFLRIP